jgi:hypothetical protein
VTSTYLINICKLGRGRECCRYLVAGRRFECAKLTPLKETIDARVAARSFSAQGDNCEGVTAGIDLDERQMHDPR